MLKADLVIDREELLRKVNVMGKDQRTLQTRVAELNKQLEAVKKDKEAQWQDYLNCQGRLLSANARLDRHLRPAWVWLGTVLGAAAGWQVGVWVQPWVSAGIEWVRMWLY